MLALAKSNVAALLTNVVVSSLGYLCLRCERPAKKRFAVSEVKLRRQRLL